MATSLSALAKLEVLHIEFESPASRPHLLLLPSTRVILPALTRFEFHGDSGYYEDLVSRIDTPSISSVETRFFNRLTFETPQFLEFVGRTKVLGSFKRAELFLDKSTAEISLNNDRPVNPEANLHILISCDALDWQLSGLAQICEQFSIFLSNVEECKVGWTQKRLEDDMDDTQWLELFRPFTSAQGLKLLSGLDSLIAPALNELTGDWVMEVLPALRTLSVTTPNVLLTPFITARQLSNHPVILIPPLQPRPPLQPWAAAELKSQYKHFGWRLWDPEPEPDSPTECVAIGDVGYISNGRFVRLFNIQRTRDDPSHRQHGVPEGYHPLPPTPFNILQQTRLDRGDYCSVSVRTINAPNGRVYQSRGRGAVLHLPDNVINHDYCGPAAKPIKNYLERNVQKFFEFARDRREQFPDVKEIILVTGYTVATSWAAAVFLDKNLDARLESQSLPNGKMNLQWHVEDHNRERVWCDTSNPTQDDPLSNQCIYIRGFQARPKHAQDNKFEIEAFVAPPQRS